MVDGIGHGALQLAAVLGAVVGDSAHDVAAAEALRVFKGAHLHTQTGLQIHQIHGDRRRAQVDGQAQQVAPVPIDNGAVVENLVAPAADHRVQVHFLFQRLGEDLGLAPHGSEIDVDVGIVDDGLAGEAVLLAQESLGLGARPQRLHAAADLDDTLVAVAHAVAGRGHQNGELVGVVEDRLAALQAPFLPIV